MTALAPSPAPVRGRTVPHARLSFARVVRSEYLKLFTVRSTWWSLAVTAALAIGIATLIAFASQEVVGDYNPVMAILAPMQFTSLVAGILGAIAITGEYSTGMIRSTLTAEPRRGAVLLAKAIVVATVIAALTVVTTAVSVLIVTPIAGADAFAWGEFDQVLSPLLLSLLAMASFALLGLGWGFIIRNGAGAIATTVGILFVLPIVLSLFAIGGEAWQWAYDLTQYLPLNAAATITTPEADGFAAGLATVLAWPAGALVLGWIVLRGRDA
jgi:ABC-2 type transport system permease protein